MENNLSRNSIICKGQKILSGKGVETNLLAFNAMAAIFSFIMIVTNGMFLFVYIARPILRCKVKILYLMLCLSDFVYGLFAFSLACILTSNKLDKQCHIMDLFISCGFLFTTLGVLSIGAIILETYLAVVKPFTHANRRDNKTVAKILTVAWIASIFLVTTLKLWLGQLWNIYSITLWIFMILLLCFIIFVQTKIYLCVKRSSMLRSRDRYAVITTFMLTLTYVLSFVPVSILGIYSKFSSHKGVLESYVLPWAYIMIGINCITDPVICTMRTPALREKVVELFNHPGNARTNPQIEH
ncbi:uncharacterized protein LOC130635902 [Hydractinia symbiolongicarpus]|uniref:uncharacterized protein LOC130635902 n=1 Tax=Hydractinia symbiolongicarpus TaxID=13093 RepID=UPI00254AA25F|nr:uncharacterized protein LOC130635902 [Hydractinia symbiolongicarpus]